MFKIGEFSRFTRVSVKMLRHYDEIGLLTPTRTDRFTGYRYYTVDQLPRLNRIIALKDLGFSLDQITHMLDERISTEEMRGMLRMRRAQVEMQIKREAARLQQIETRLRLIDQTDHPELSPLHDVVIREIPAVLAATRRQIVIDDGGAITQLLEEVEAFVATHHARATECPFIIFYDEEYRETMLEIEVVIPLTRQIPPTERVLIRELPGLAQMATVIYQGSYDLMGDALGTLMRWVDANGYVVVGPLREVYLRFSSRYAEEWQLPTSFLATTSAEFVTELQIPVEKRETKWV